MGLHVPYREKSMNRKKHFPKIAPRVQNERYTLCPSCAEFLGLSDDGAFCVVLAPKRTEPCPRCHVPVILPLAVFCPSCGIPLRDAAMSDTELSKRMVLH